MQDAVLGRANISVYDAPEERVVVVSYALPKLYTLSRASWSYCRTGYGVLIGEPRRQDPRHWMVGRVRDGDGLFDLSGCDVLQDSSVHFVLP